MGAELIETVRAAETQPGLRALMAVRDAAEAAASECDVLLKALEPNSTAAAQWARAALLEAAGRLSEAHDVLTVMPELSWGDARAMRWLALARMRGRLGRADAGLALRDAIRAAESYRLLRQADAVLRELKRTGAPWRDVRPYRISLLSTFNADFLPEVLRPLLFAAGVSAEFHVGPFGQVAQVLMEGDPGIEGFQPNLIILAMDWRSIDVTQSPEDHVRELRRLWDRCHDRFGAAVIQFNYEIPVADPMGRLSRLLPKGRRRQIEAVNAALWNAEAAGAGAVVFDVELAAAEFGKRGWSDPASWEISRQYPAPAALPLFGRRLVSTIRALLGLTSKCLVMDLDGVVWGGVIGEDGMAGVRLGGSGSGAAHAAFQRYCLALKSRGVLLAVCSKNNPEDALQAFREHPEMVLRESDIAVFAVNWDAKEDNLRVIARTLNIDLDSLVFVDDNPAERERVRQQLPMVEVPELSQDPAGFVEAIERNGLFESLSISAEDLLRTESIRANVEREAIAAGSADSTAYLHSLQMCLLAKPFDESDLPRIVQLFNKTNQFNLTTRRIVETQARGWIENPEVFTLSLRLRDRFGDFGLTGLMVAFEEERKLHIDSWLMSCRILGRGVEEAMLYLVADEARRRRCSSLEGRYIPTAKNSLVSGLYPRFGFAPVESSADGSCLYRLAIENAAITAPPYLRVERASEKGTPR